MKSLYFYMGHRDLVGGGGLALYYMAWALQDQFEVSLSCEPHPGMSGYEFLEPPRLSWKIGRPAEVDVFLASSYTERINPDGRNNLFYTFYPRMAAPPGYDKILTISQYSRQAVMSRWKHDPNVICGGVFSNHYHPHFPKKAMILNSSRFFIEGNADTFCGHSKNQHILISAFLQLRRAEHWKLVLAGSVLTEEDRIYFKACQKLAGGDPRVEFRPMLGKYELAELYGLAKIFVHAMGYGRNDPAETEHYGFCVEKAVLCGCYTLVHNSGGAPELSNAVWRNPEDLVNALQVQLDCGVNNEAILEKARRRSLDDWRREVKEVFVEWA